MRNNLREAQERTEAITICIYLTLPLLLTIYIINL
jgi:hypothetical protein